MPKLLNLPLSADLRPYSGGLDVQEATNSCIAHRDTTAMEILLYRAGIDKQLSRLFHYFNLREQSAMQGSDNGGRHEISYKVLMSIGVCEESIWPFDISRINVKPSDDAYKAATYKITGCETIALPAGSPEQIEAMRVWLAKGYPILFAADLHPDFGSMRNLSDLPATSRYITSNFLRRSNRSFPHAMLIDGYTADGWIIENSLGREWGCGGYALFPFEFFNAYCRDFQVITGIQGVTLKDLWVPQYESAPVPKPAPVVKKHTLKCKIKMAFGRKCSCS